MSHAESITNYTTAAACALIYQANAPLPPPFTAANKCIVVKLNIARRIMGTRRCLLQIFSARCCCVTKAEIDARSSLLALMVQ
jgi:hypothetical protein